MVKAKQTQKKKEKDQKKVIAEKSKRGKQIEDALLKDKKGKKDGDKKRKKVHFKPGTVALREIRKEQKSTKLLIRMAPIRRLIREIIQEFKSDVRIQKGALEALHHYIEAYVIRIFECANHIACENKRVTMYKRDINIVAKIIHNEMMVIPQK